MNLRIPGPVPCRPEILEATAHQMINHRGPEFGALLQRLTENLQRVLGTKRDILFLTASGTGGLESAVVNTLCHGDAVLGVSAGSFGERFCSIAAAYGANVIRVNVEWGQAVEPDCIRQALRNARNVRAVLLTHNETSTGVTHPLSELCRVIHSESDALIVVDGISSLGGIPLPMDEWGVDVVVTGSQKAWGVPPGVAMVVAGPRAWEAYATAKMPRFYFDWVRYRDAAQKGQYPYTPALSVFFALDTSLHLMIEEGMESVYQRHARVGSRAREAARSIGLSLLAEERFASNTVTAVRVPEGIDGKELNRVLREKHDTIVGGGLGPLVGRIFRVGHLGWVTEEDINKTFSAVDQALREIGRKPLSK